MTMIPTFEDMLEAMERNPALRDALRRHILTEELLQLPARFDRLEADVTELKAGQTRLEADVTELKAGQTRLEADVTELKAGQTRLEAEVTELKAGQTRLERRQDRMEGKLDNIIGSDYERRAARRSRIFARSHLNLRRPEVLMSAITQEGTLVADILEDACDRGIITDDQVNDMYAADIILWGTRGESEKTYAVIEVSVTIDSWDITRARQRSEVIAVAAGQPALAAVIGVVIDEETRARAGAEGVEVILMEAEDT